MQNSSMNMAERPPIMCSRTFLRFLHGSEQSSFKTLLSYSPNTQNALFGPSHPSTHVNFKILLNPLLAFLHGQKKKPDGSLNDFLRLWQRRCVELSRLWKYDKIKTGVTLTPNLTTFNHLSSAMLVQSRERRDPRWPLRDQLVRCPLDMPWSPN